MHRCQINKKYWKEVEAEIARCNADRIKQIRKSTDKRLLKLILALDHIDRLEVMNSSYDAGNWDLTFSIASSQLGWRTLTLIAWAIGKVNQRSKPARFPDVDLICWACPDTSGLFTSCFEIRAKNTDPNMLAKIIEKNVGK